MGSIADKVKSKLGLDQTPLQREAAVKRSLEERGVTSADVVATDAPPPAREKKKPTRIRKCCGTVRGTDHLPTCQTLKPPKTPEERLRAKEEKKLNLPQRLPHAARFDVMYSADTESWSGTLDVDGKIFSSSNSAVFRLLRDLDRQFRNSV